MRFFGMVLAVFLTAAPFAGAAESQAAPSGTATTLDFANGLYARKMYEPAASEYAKFIAANPASPELASARFRYADSFYFLGNFKESAKLFEAFVDDYPDDARVFVALLRLGIARYSLKELPAAIRIFSGISEDAEDPNVKSAALYYLAKCYQDEDKNEKSVDLFRKLVELYPESEYASYGAVAAGDVLLKEGNEEGALGAYSFAAEKNDPIETAHEAVLKSAGIHFKKQDWAEARTSYQKLFDALGTPEEGLSAEDAVRRESVRMESLLGLFYTDYYLEDLETSEKRLEAQQALIVKNDSQPEIFFVTASLLADRGKTDLALARLDEVLANPKTDADLKEKTLLKKTSLLYETGKRDKALAEVEKLFSKGQTSARALFERAGLLAELGKYEAALADYATLILKYPDSEYAKAAAYRSAGVYWRAGDAKTAIERLRAFAAKYPSDPNADSALLQIMQIHLDTKDFAAAEKEAGEFIKNHPKSAALDVAFYKLAVATAGQQKYKEAADAFSRILSSWPESKLTAEALYGAGSSFQNAGDLNAAVPFYERLMNKYPLHPMTAEVTARVGYIYIQSGSFDKVKTFYEDLLFRRKDVAFDPDGVFWLIRQLLDRGDYTSLEAILKALPGRFPGANLTHETRFFEAEAAMGRGDYVKAVDLYNQSIQAGPEGAYVAYAYLGAGVALSAKGDAAGAETNFNQAMHYEQELNVTMRARFELANLRLKKNNLEEASKLFMLVAILYDDAKYTPAALYKAAECFASLGKADDALKAWQELKTHYPKSEWASKPAPVIVIKRESAHV